MTAYVGRVLTALSSALEFNSATLSGAIDVIVVEDERGRRHSSPFHVRFGKLQLLKAGGCPVTVELNGRQTKLRLLLGPGGEAYFYNPASHDSPASSGGPSASDAPRKSRSHLSEQVVAVASSTPSGSTKFRPSPPASDTLLLTRANTQPNQATRPATPLPSDAGSALARTKTSPIAIPSSQRWQPVDAVDLARSNDGVSATSLQVPPLEDTAAGYVSDSEVEVSRHERDGTAEVVDEPRSPPVSAVERRIMKTYARSRSLRERKKANTATATPTRTPAKTRVAPTEPSPVGDLHSAVLGLGDRQAAPDVVMAMDEGIPAAQRQQEHRREMLEDRLDASEGKDSSAFGVVDMLPLDNSPQRAAEVIDELPLQSAVEIIVDGEDAPVKAVGEGISLDSGSYSVPVPTASSEQTLVAGLASLSLSREAENETIIAEESKLEIRSLDGLDDDDLDDGGMACLSVGSVPRGVALPGAERVSAERLPNPEELSRAIANALDGVSLDDLFVARHSMVRSGTVEESDFDQNSMLVMSLCGKKLEPGMSEEQVGDLVEAHRVSYSEFAANPNLLFNPDLLFCIDDRLVEFRIAAPFVMSSLAFGIPLDVDLLSTQMQALPRMPSNLRSVEHNDSDKQDAYGNGIHDGKAGESSSASKGGENNAPKEAIKSGGRFGWFGWSRSAAPPSPPIGEPLLSEEDLLALEGNLTDSAGRTPLPEEVVSWPGDLATAETTPQGQELGEAPRGSVGATYTFAGTDEQAPRSAVGKLRCSSTGPKRSSAELMRGADDETVDRAVLHAAEREQLLQLQDEQMTPMFDPHNSRFSLTPTSEVLAELDLRPGPNAIRFIVEASSAEVDCRIFLWGPDTKIVISDVDGTITRSDVLGHVLPAVGRDWSHVGVAGLYTEIAKHGYKFMYLTARPIGMASTTRDFLHSVTQGGARLPNGPVLMSPNRLVESFTREVIRRKPQEFKIAALREVRSLFAMDYNPFHAGFGNRDTDVISYRAVGLVPHRIFVVNTAAELVVNSVRYESAGSYSTLRDLVISVFPDIGGKVGRELVHNVTDGALFNSWNFWKPPLPEVDLDALLAEEGD
jgi:LNS2 (Lipin/Ned1/Smp2)/lipin, N-terminal conserved region/Lipin/Ned1/Smp2 multi-domain protein middle domain